MGTDSHVVAAPHWPLVACLDDLESRIDDQVERDVWRQWCEFHEGKCTSPAFRPKRQRAIPAGRDWPKVPVNATLDDFDAMALHQLRQCSRILDGDWGGILNVRCNYGTPIMPMLFGVELFIMPEETDTLPTCHPLSGGADAIRRMLDAGEPSLDQPYMSKVWEMGARFKEIQSRFPGVGRHVHLYHPDMQGPTDILEMLVGSEMFMLLMDEPELVHQGLQLITNTYIRVMRRWQTIQPFRTDGLSTHWSWVHRGNIMLRDDSAMNLSPDMFNEFVRPYDQRLYDEFGGGAMHACGRVDHFVPFLAQMPGLTGFNMSQPHLNDVEKVLQNTVDHGLPLLSLNPAAAEPLIASGRPLRGRVYVG